MELITLVLLGTLLGVLIKLATVRGELADALRDADSANRQVVLLSRLLDQSQNETKRNQRWLEYLLPLCTAAQRNSFQSMVGQEETRDLVVVRSHGVQLRHRIPCPRLPVEPARNDCVHVTPPSGLPEREAASRNRQGLSASTCGLAARQGPAGV